MTLHLLLLFCSLLVFRLLPVRLFLILFRFRSLLIVACILVLGMLEAVGCSSLLEVVLLELEFVEGRLLAVLLLELEVVVVLPYLERASLKLAFLLAVGPLVFLGVLAFVLAEKRHS